MRNFNIDLLRMVFAILVVVAHMSVMDLIPEFVAGPIVVFFFVLTGYFAVASYERHKDSPQSAGAFLVSKLMRVMPYLIVAAIVTFALQTILQMDYYGYDPGESIVSSILSFFGDVSCLNMFGMGFIRGNVAVWFISGMMFGLMVTYPVLLRYGHSFSSYAAPLIGVICIATCLRLTGSLYGPYEEVWGVTKGMLISVGSICLGYFAYECVSRLGSCTLTPFGRRLLGFIELACYVLGVAMVASWSWINSGHLEGYLSKEWYEMMAICLMFVGAVLTCSGKTSLAVDISDRPALVKLSSFFATGSLALYLSNYYQIYFVSKMMKTQPLEEQILLIIAFVGVSFVLVYIGGKLLQKYGGSLGSKMVVKPDFDTSHRSG